MASSTTVAFTATAGSVVLTQADGGARVLGAPADILKSTDFKTRDPIAWVVASEFNENSTGSGTVTISAA